MKSIVLMIAASLVSLLAVGCADTKPTSSAAQATQSATTTPAVVTPAKVEPPVATNATPAAVAPSAKPAKTRLPEVLLSSRSKNGEQLIIAFDFAGTLGMDKSQPLDERRQYVAEHVQRLYQQDFAKLEKAGQKVKVFALGVPNRDDYFRGDFRNTDELAICETTHDQLTAGPATLERLGTIEWRAALK